MNRAFVDSMSVLAVGIYSHRCVRFYGAKEKDMTEYGGILGSAVELPYVDEGVDLAGRVILLVPFYSKETEEWFAFFDIGQRRLRRVQLVDVVSGLLLTSEPLKSDEDLLIPLADLFFQRMSFTHLIRPFQGLFNVVENCASIMELYDHISQMHVDNHPGARQLAQTLVNQLMITCRSLYDVLHDICREACSTVKSPNDLSKSLIQSLNERASKMILKDEKPRAADDLVARYNLPPSLANFYSAQARVFSFIRKARDKVVHRGRNAAEPGYIFNLDEGLAVRIDDPPWRDLSIWDEHSVERQEFGSLRKVIAYLVSEVLVSTTQFATAYSSCIAMPQAVSGGNHLFLRSPLNHHLMELEQILDAPWERQGQDA